MPKSIITSGILECCIHAITGNVPESVRCKVCFEPRQGLDMRCGLDEARPRHTDSGSVNAMRAPVLTSLQAGPASRRYRTN